MERLRFLVFVLSVVVMPLTNHLHAAGPENWCGEIKKELAEKQKRLQEYLQALQATYDGGDRRIADALNHKIKQLKEELEVFRQEAADCTGYDSETMAQGLKSSKADEAKYAGKSCGELRKVLFPLLVKTRALKRKEKSLLSGLTPQEEADLASYTEQLTTVSQILRTRCADGDTPPRGSLLQKLRR